MIFFRVIVSPLDANKTAFRFVGEEKKGWQAFGSQGCTGAGWSSLAARRAHNPKVVGSNPAPATKVDRVWMVVQDSREAEVKVNFVEVNLVEIN